MDLRQFQQINSDRGKRWHQGNLLQWTLLEWCGAMCGEAGEAANYAKKIRRLDLQLPNKEAGLNKSNYDELRIKLGNEIADTIIYGLLTLSALDLDAEQMIRNVFDKKSEEYGFPERTPR